MITVMDKLKAFKSKLRHCQKLSISFSGGETSAYMTKLLIDELKDSDIAVSVVFANTGQENEQTLEFVRDCEKWFNYPVSWIESVPYPGMGEGVGYNLVDFDSASRKGEPFERMIEKYGIPNVSFPHCSRVLKSAAIKAHDRDVFGSRDCYYTAIGIRADEIDRMSRSAGKNRILYPLVDCGIIKNHINYFWSGQTFRLKLKGYQGNCQACWKKSDRKLMTIASETPTAFDFCSAMEVKHGSYRPETQPNRPLPARFFRENKSVADIFSKASKGFIPASDDSLDVRYQGNIFEEIDLTNGCSEGCEAFSDED